MTQEQLAHQLEQTALDPRLTAPQVHALVAGAMEYGLASICVTPVWVARVATMLRGGGNVSLCTTVGFPHGTHKATIKAIEATSSIKDGSSEIAVVPHLPNLIKPDPGAARSELMEIVRAARATRRDVVVRVFIESATLMQKGSEATIESACRAVRESGCDAIVTSTGYDPAGGATVEAIRLLRKHGEGLLIHAYGAIEDAGSAIELIRAGADRVLSDAAIEMLESDAQV
ncbi:MAG TPA: deoxyribose-phosphate aldolase [Tepidisphaeraceae bacterium]|jgi:deoxyribose-phosphate aldolase|nr:deoxyribose-phosphate aldolase [Tepidisphaeraceae bacterium]